VNIKDPLNNAVQHKKRNN